MVKMLRPRLSSMDTRTVRPPPKKADAELQTVEHMNWRAAVLRKADRRCEVVENGVRCPKAEPDHRMFADHIIERRDGGDPLDPMNGQCLCGSHHTLKTGRARAARLSRDY